MNKYQTIFDKQKAYFNTDAVYAIWRRWQFGHWQLLWQIRL